MLLSVEKSFYFLSLSHPIHSASFLNEEDKGDIVNEVMSPLFLSYTHTWLQELEEKKEKSVTDVTGQLSLFFPFVFFFEQQQKIIFFFIVKFDSFQTKKKYW